MKKKLELKKIVLRDLDSAELVKVVGGGPNDLYTQLCPTVTCFNTCVPVCLPQTVLQDCQ